MFRAGSAPAVDVRFAPPRLVHELDGLTMGTSWRMTLVGPPGLRLDALRRAVDSRLDTLIAQLSHWEPDSAISRFNQAAAGQWVALPDDLCHVLACGLAVARVSEGAFDPTIGALVAEWGFGPHARYATPAARAAGLAALPTSQAIEAARQRSGWQKVTFDPQGARARQAGGLLLDLSGIAKGYAVDQLALLVRNAGVTDCLVEIGGELSGFGQRPDRRPWQVAIATPGTLTAAEPPRVALSGLAIASSGDHWQAWTLDGRRYSHTIDPRSGRPVSEALAGVTVLHEQCMWADALATALLVLGPEAGMDFAQRYGLRAAFSQRDASRGDEFLRVTAGFHACLQ